MKTKAFWLLSLLVLSGLLLSRPVYSQTSYLFGQAQFATGQGPISVIVGDFNGDGILDLAVANASGTVSILLGKPDGTFAPRVDYPTGTSPSSVVAADFNGDGKLDLAVTNEFDNTVSILIGNGDGTFQSHIDLPVGLYPISLTAGDFNGDGKIDLAAANSGDNTVSILLGNGNGTFQPQVPYAAGPSPFSVATGDFNGDGKLDLVVATYGAFSVATLRGNGDGTFQAPVDQPVGFAYNPFDVVVADLNGDGIPDLAVASTQSGSSQDYVSVLLGNGDGTFQSAVNYTCVSFVSSIAAADFNGDGKLDLVVGNGYADYLSVFINKGDGTFEPRTDYSAGLIPVSVATGDFNGDGKLDLVTANSQDNNVAVLLGSGDGTFQSHSDYATGNLSQGIVAADFNGDGHPDLATADCGSNTVSVLIGNADGTFQPRLSFAVGQCPVAITAADFNGDGKIDLAVANQTDSTVSILLGNGDGTFQARTDYALPYSAIAIAAADFNRDGRQDVIVLASGGVGVFSILFGNGDGTFQPHTDYGTGTGIGPTALTVGDFNGDGIPDLAITGSAYLTGTLAIQLGNGDGTFAARVIIQPFTLLSSPTAVAVGDFNHDGKLDLAIAEGASQFGRIDILLGSGDGNFQFPMQSFTTALFGAQSVVTADFNGDGILDLAVGSSSMSILLGNGDGTFQTHMDHAGAAYRLVTADFDGDGRPDLAATAGTSLVSVFLNKPPTQRVSKPPSITSVFPPTATQGQTIPTFTANGSNFDPKATLSFNSGNGIVISSQSVIGTTQITANITIAGNAPLGAQDVIVTNSDGQKGTLPGGFIVVVAPTGTINVTTNLQVATFTIAGPANFSGSGTSTTFTNAPIGDYTINYGNISGYVTPSSSNQTLAAGASLSFIANYLPTTGGGSIFVVSNRPEASFAIAGPLAYIGAGSISLLQHMPPGTYTTTYGNVAGYFKPPDQTFVVNNGGTTTFLGNYRRLILALFAGLSPDNPSSMQTFLSSVTDATNYPSTFIPGVVGEAFAWDTLQVSPTSLTTFVTSNIQSPEDRVALMGHSYGGNTARLLATRLRRNNDIIADALVTIDPIDPKVCHPSQFDAILDCLVPFRAKSCIQSNDYYDPPPQVTFLVDYVENFSFCPLINGYNFTAVPSIVVSGDTHTTIDDDEPNVRVPTRLLLYNLSRIPKSLSLTISAVRVTSISAHSALVTWKTNIDCSSLIELGKSGAYDSVVSDQARVHTHSVLLSGLLPSTVYHYSVVATASSDPSATTKDAIFITKRGP